jgi:[ribosomal protein S5]-alanine N-acetyltransferase
LTSKIKSIEVDGNVVTVDLLTPQLLTARLSLRRPTTGDIDAILAIHRDPRACIHNPSDALTTRAEAEDLFSRWDEHWRRFGFGYWVVRCRESAEPIGFAGVKLVRFDQRRVLNLFYRFTPSTWGSGLASEAASAVVAWAGESLAEYPIVARVRPDNVASQRVATKSGLVRARHLDSRGYDGIDWVYVSPFP